MFITASVGYIFVEIGKICFHGFIFIKKTLTVSSLAGNAFQQPTPSVDTSLFIRTRAAKKSINNADIVLPPFQSISKMFLHC